MSHANEAESFPGVFRRRRAELAPKRDSAPYENRQRHISRLFNIWTFFSYSYVPTEAMAWQSATVYITANTIPYSIVAVPNGRED